MIMGEYQESDMPKGEHPPEPLSIRKAIWKTVLGRAREHKNQRTEDLEVWVLVRDEKGMAHRVPLSEAKFGRDDAEGSEFSMSFSELVKAEGGTHTVRNVVIGLSFAGLAGLAFYMYRKKE